jgi:hypothetical protein
MVHHLSRDVLGCVVTGYARGGTTVAKDLIAKATGMDTGFEGGLLLAEKPADMPKLYTGMLIGGWELSSDEVEQVTRQPDFRAAYATLRARSKMCNPRNPILDKTPEYMSDLRNVMRRAPETPVVIVLRDPLEVLGSHMRRVSKNLQEHEDRVVAWTKEAFAATQDASSRNRIAILRYDDIISDGESAVSKIAKWLGVERARSLKDGKAVGYDAIPRYAYGETQRKDDLGIVKDCRDAAIRALPESEDTILARITQKVGEAAALWEMATGPVVQRKL